MKQGNSQEASYEEVLEEAGAGNLHEQHILLGNGFNMAIGADTSYPTLCNKLINYSTIKMLDKCLWGSFKDTIADKPNDLEKHISQVACPAHRMIIKEVLYRQILSQCRLTYNRDDLTTFLDCFKDYYTTNYDPLLYLYLLYDKGEEPDEEDPFYKALEEIDSEGKITNTGREEKRLRRTSIEHVCDYAYGVLKKDKKFKGKSRSDCYNTLKVIRGGHIIKAADGFLMKPLKKSVDKKYMGWSKKAARKYYNKNMDRKHIFYLHGALHFYEAGPPHPIRKGVIDTGSTFIEHILRQDIDPLCVFNQSGEEKLDRINENKYLEDCKEHLEEASGKLFIVGWSASNDSHLVDIIAGNEKIEKLIVSYYDDGTKAVYEDKFRDKNKTFFDIRKAHFYREIKNDAPLLSL